MFADSRYSAYEVLIVLRMRPPSAKRCVMMCGCRTTETSVWMWNTRPLCRTLLLNPSRGDGAFTFAGRPDFTTVTAHVRQEECEPSPHPRQRKQRSSSST